MCCKIIRKKTGSVMLAKFAECPFPLPWKPRGVVVMGAVQPLSARKGDLPPPFFLGAAACHGGVGGPIGPIASKEGRFYNRPASVTQKAKEDLQQKNGLCYCLGCCQKTF